MEKGFKCENCHFLVKTSKLMGTYHRNHCPNCLWSKHVDEKFSGDRKCLCRGIMEPIGLTFKDEGVDKHGKKRQGELMIAHRCQECDRVSINRIAGDDNPKAILELFENSLVIDSEERETLKDQEIELLEGKDRSQLEIQLFGKKF